MKNQLLKSFMQHSGMSQKQVSNAFGVSLTVVSQYLNGKYPGNTDELDRKTEDLIAQTQEKRVDKQYNAEFVPTFAARQMMEVIRDAHVEGDVSVIFGAAGLGKTQAVKQYAKEYSGAIVIETAPSFTPKVLLQKICAHLNLNTNGAMETLFENIIGKLVSSQRVIIVDEAELLSTRALEFLRRIQDMTKIGLVLVGMPRLLINLKGKNNELAQLYSRVWRACDLGNALPDRDLLMLAENALGNAEHAPIFLRYAKGNARRLSKLIRGVVRLSQLNECEIDETLIKEYTNMLIN